MHRVRPSLISDAISEYDDRRYREALAFYRTALKMTGGDQLRVRSGIYLANWKLNRRDDATDAFGSLVDYSLTTPQPDLIHPVSPARFPVERRDGTA
jgi:hypothetical protein